MRFPFGSGLCNFAKNHTEKRKQVNRHSESRRKIKGTETRPFLKTLSFCKTITEASFAFSLNQNKNRDEKSFLFSFYKVHSSQINKASFAFFLNQNKNRDEKSSLFSFLQSSFKPNQQSFFCLLFFSKKRRSVLLLNAFVFVVIAIIRTTFCLTADEIRHFVLVKTDVTDIFIGYVIIDIKFARLARRLHRLFLLFFVVCHHFSIYA